MNSGLSPEIPQQFLLVGGIAFIVVILLSLLCFVFTIFIWCKICSKTGHHWALGLLMIVPIANLILPVLLAFSEWPIHRQLKEKN